MKKDVFHLYSPFPDQGPDVMLDKFVNGDHIKKNDIKRYAKDLANMFINDKLTDREKEVLVWNKLSDDALKRWPDLSTNINTRLNISLNDPQIYSVLDNIRRAVIEELKFFLDVDQYYLVKRYINNRLSEIRGPDNEDKIFRKHWQYGPEESVNKHVEAMQKYKDIPKSKYLLEVDEVFIRPWSIDSLAKKINVVDLWSIVVSEELLDIERIIEIVVDNMRGAIHLFDNGLVMFDIYKDNLGYDKESKCGKLFDYDGLYPRGKSIESCDIPVHGDYYAPPELLKINVDPKEFDTDHGMVYQFGVSLGDIVEELNLLLINNTDNKFFKVKVRLNNLISKMKSIVPKERPSLKECVEELETIKKETEA